MYFTQEDYNKIEEALQKRTIKDSQFPTTEHLNKRDLVPIVQEGYNKVVPLCRLLSLLKELSPSDIYNITENTNKTYDSIESAIKDVPVSSRKKGLVITYSSEDVWVIYQFNGSTRDQWFDTELWVPVYDPVCTGNHRVLPDDEDIEGFIKDTKTYFHFKDREYNPDEFSGKGSVILRRNLVGTDACSIDDEDHYNNILTQSDIAKANTVYVIRYDFDLQGNTIIIPKGCVLVFNGGSLNNGTVTLNETSLQGLNCITDAGTVTFDGVFKTGQILSFREGNSYIVKWYNKDKWVPFTDSTVDVNTIVEQYINDMINNVDTSIEKLIRALNIKFDDLSSTIAAKVLNCSCGGTGSGGNNSGDSSGDSSGSGDNNNPPGPINPDNPNTPDNPDDPSYTPSSPDDINIGDTDNPRNGSFIQLRVNQFELYEDKLNYNLSTEPYLLGSGNFVYVDPAGNIKKCNSGITESISNIEGKYEGVEFIYTTTKMDGVQSALNNLIDRFPSPTAHGTNMKFLWKINQAILNGDLKVLKGFLRFTGDPSNPVYAVIDARDLVVNDDSYVIGILHVYQGNKYPFKDSNGSVYDDINYYDKDYYLYSKDSIMIHNSIAYNKVYDKFVPYFIRLNKFSNGVLDPTNTFSEIEVREISGWSDAPTNIVPMHNYLKVGISNVLSKIGFSQQIGISVKGNYYNGSYTPDKDTKIYGYGIISASSSSDLPKYGALVDPPITDRNNGRNLPGILYSNKAETTNSGPYLGNNSSLDSYRVGEDALANNIRGKIVFSGSLEGEQIAPNTNVVKTYTLDGVLENNTYVRAYVANVIRQSSGNKEVINAAASGIYKYSDGSFIPLKEPMVEAPGPLDPDNPPLQPETPTPPPSINDTSDPVVDDTNDIDDPWYDNFTRLSVNRYDANEGNPQCNLFVDYLTQAEDRHGLSGYLYVNAFGDIKSRQSPITDGNWLNEKEGKEVGIELLVQPIDSSIPIYLKTNKDIVNTDSYYNRMRARINDGIQKGHVKSIPGRFVHIQELDKSYLDPNKNAPKGGYTIGIIDCSSLIEEGPEAYYGVVHVYFGEKIPVYKEGTDEVDFYRYSNDMYLYTFTGTHATASWAYAPYVLRFNKMFNGNLNPNNVLCFKKVYNTNIMNLYAGGDPFCNITSVKVNNNNLVLEGTTGTYGDGTTASSKFYDIGYEWKMTPELLSSYDELATNTTIGIYDQWPYHYGYFPNNGYTERIFSADSNNMLDSNAIQGDFEETFSIMKPITNNPIPEGAYVRAYIVNRITDLGNTKQIKNVVASDIYKMENGTLKKYNDIENAD